MSNAITNSDQWFDVDRAGLAANMSSDDRARTIAELLQNAWDADGVTRVEVTLVSAAERGIWSLRVEDDAPDGFADLTHSYRLYARSTKRNDPTKRGRFNEGEKKVLALCVEAAVSSTTGTVVFRENGQREAFPTWEREGGSCFDARIRLTEKEGALASRWLHRCVSPAGVHTTINGLPLFVPTTRSVLSMSLPTIVDGEDGTPNERVRLTSVSLIEPDDDGKAWLYEMGLPVVRLGDDRWSLDIGQKVPLNRDRDNVRPAWLRRLRAQVANEAVSMLSGDEARARWVSAAIAAPEAEVETIRSVVEARYGKKAVTFDPSDREANKIAASKGYTVIPPGAFDREGWSRIREAEILRPAGQVTPSPAVAFSPDGIPPMTPDEYSDPQGAAARYAAALGEALLGRSVRVSIHRSLSSRNGSGVAACYGGGSLNFNAAGFHQWGDRRALDALLLHEFAHEYADDHFSHGFLDAICTLGAKLRDVTIRLEDYR